MYKRQVEHQSDNRAGFTLAYAIAAILWIFAVINQINLTVTNPVSYTHLDVYKRQVGGSPVDSIQYELIDKQFDCMAKYLSWDMLFNKSYYATAYRTLIAC